MCDDSGSILWHSNAQCDHMIEHIIIIVKDYKEYVTIDIAFPVQEQDKVKKYQG